MCDHLCNIVIRAFMAVFLFWLVMVTVFIEIDLYHVSVVLKDIRNDARNL